MLQHPAEPKDRTALVRASAVACVAVLHLAVLGAILAAPSEPEFDMADALEIQFVEIGPEFVDTVASPEPEEVVEEVPPEPEPEPVVEPEPEPEPEIEPEPEPEPEPIPEPEPEPEPEAIQEPPPPPPPPKPKPKPKPKPAPKPVPKQDLPVSETAQPPASPKGNADVAAKPMAPQTTPDNKPRLIGTVDYLGRKPNAQYPRISQRRGESGRVVIRVLISPRGEVDEATVRASSGYERLDESALRAARSARFRPYTENGVAYPALADIPFDFVLN